MPRMTRRRFLEVSAGSCLMAALPLGGCGSPGDDDDDDNDASPTPNGDDDDNDNNDDTPADGRSTVNALLFDELTELFDQTRAAMTKLGVTKGSLTGSTVFIKPNFVSLGLGDRGFLGASGECTKAELAAAAAEMCLQAGAAKVTIGDGAQGDHWDWSIVHFLSGNSFHGATNLASAVDYLNAKYGAGKCALVCLNQHNQWSLIPSCSDDPLAADGVPVAQHWHDADHVVSLPVIKSHMWARFTGAMKNYVGVYPVHDPMGAGFVRQKLHAIYAHATMHGRADIGIAGAFLDAHRWRVGAKRQDFAIVDCSVGVEGSGPHVEPVNPGITIDLKQRTPVGKYFLLAATDFVAADYIMSKVMNFGTVVQLAMARRLGLGQTQDGVNLVGANLSELVVADWKPPIRMSEEFFVKLDNLFNHFPHAEQRWRGYRRLLRESVG